MAETIDRLTAIIDADISGLQAGLKAATGLLGGFALAGAAAFAVKSASDFDKTMRNVQATARLSSEKMKELSTAVREVGSMSTFGAQKAGEAFYDIVGGVQDSSKWMGILEQSISTAQAGQADLMETTRGLVFITNAYNMSAKEMTGVSDVLTRTVGVGVGTMSEFVNAMSPIAVTAKTLGIQFKDLGKMTGFISTKGNTAAESATQLQSVMQALLKPNTAMEKQLKKLGFASGSAAVKQLGFIGTLKALKKSVGGSTDALAQMFGRVEGFKGVLALTGNDFTKFGTDFETGLKGATAAAEQIQLGGFDAKFKMFQSSLQSLAIQIGQVLLPPLAKVVEFMTMIVERAEGGFNRVKDFIAALFAPGDVGARIAGVISQAIPKLQQAAGELLTKVGAFLSENFPKVVSAFQDILGKVGDWLSSGGLTKLVGSLVDLIRGVVDWFGTTGWPLFKMGVETLWGNLVKFVQTDGVQRFLGGVRSMIQQVGAWLADPGEGGAKFMVTGLINAVGEMTRWLIEKGIPEFNKAFGQVVAAIGKFLEKELPKVIQTAVEHGLVGAFSPATQMVIDQLKSGKPGTPLPPSRGVDLSGLFDIFGPGGMGSKAKELLNSASGNTGQTKRGRAFASGGYTGSQSGVAGIVHGREFVVPERGALVMKSGGGNSGPSRIVVQLYTDRLIDEIDVNLAAAMAGG